MSYFQIHFRSNSHSGNNNSLWVSKITKIAAIAIVSAGLFWFALADAYAFGLFQNQTSVVKISAEPELSTMPLFAATGDSNPGVLYEYFEL